MNYRYLQIIATCLIAGTVTLALRQNDSGVLINTPSEKLDAPPKLETKAITFKPEISDDNLAYKHTMGTFSPTEISLTVNDQEIKINNHEPITIAVTDNTITARCKYKFIAGYKGNNTSTWKLKPGENHTVTFSWNTPEKIHIENAELAACVKE